MIRIIPFWYISFCPPNSSSEIILIWGVCWIICSQTCKGVLSSIEFYFQFLVGHVHLIGITSLIVKLSVVWSIFLFISFLKGRKRKISSLQVNSAKDCGRSLLWALVFWGGIFICFHLLLLCHVCHHLMMPLSWQVYTEKIYAWWLGCPATH